MKNSSILVTGSCGLIGSEVCAYFAQQGFQLVGVDNNMRAKFFGPEGDTGWVLERLNRDVPGYRHAALDIRDGDAMKDLLQEVQPSLVVHAAAQPSHDRATSIPVTDFEVNALGTLNLLEAVRQCCPETPFVHMSTNKVYGDRPNSIAMDELAARWDYSDPAFANGISESLSIDQSRHSLFGASKVAADVLVQEFGRTYGMPTCCLRAGCLTGPNHSGVELHGFLSYLIKCNVEERPYTVYGYKGKQVRDNIHSLDIARFIHEFWKSPRSAAVYNIGGGKENSCSILEAFQMAEDLTGKEMSWSYSDQHRGGDHICYYSDLSRAQTDYPSWSITKPLAGIFEEIVESWVTRTAKEPVG